MPTTAELLAFESQWPGWSGAKEIEIESRFGVRPARYYVLLHRAVQTREALKVDPMTTHRVLRQLSRGARERQSRVG